MPRGRASKTSTLFFPSRGRASKCIDITQTLLRIDFHQVGYMTVTIYDVAKKAGVGIGTVSRAINNSPNITPETKAAVMTAIKELHYQPHALAQGLARKKTHMIAVILPVFTGYFYLELLKAIQREASTHGYDLILYSVDQTDKTDVFLRRTLQEKRVDGVLLISLKISDKFADRFVNSSIPIVLVDHHHSQLDSIYVENNRGAYDATAHLIKLGHKKIGIIDAHLRSIPAQTRLEGYRQALSDADLPVVNAYMIIGEHASEVDGFNREAGYDAMHHLLSLPDPPSAVFVASDVQAAGAVQACREAGLHIPDQMAIVGFDDIEIAHYLGLSTMHQPLDEMGSLAFIRLLERMTNPDLDVLQKVYSTQLVVRNTCGGKR